MSTPSVPDDGPPPETTVTCAPSIAYLPAVLPVASTDAKVICHACGQSEMLPVADLGAVPVLCGVHWASQAEAMASPVGQIRLAYCPTCAYTRNVAFDPNIMVYDKTMDTNLHYSPAFAEFTTELVHDLCQRHALAGKRVLDIGCGQGEFLRELCAHGRCRGIGYDAMYAGRPGRHGPATFHSHLAPRGRDLPPYDFFTSRHWLEHLADPFDFLVDLWQAAQGREVHGYVEVPDAAYDLATAGWEVIYPHVSYFDTYSLCRIFARAGWSVEAAGHLFSGMFTYVEVSANRSGVSRRPADQAAILPALDARDRQLAAIHGFSQRHQTNRQQWRSAIATMNARDCRPVLWGAGSRGVQFLTLADAQRGLCAVVDVNPRKWGRYLPVSGHRVDCPESLAGLQPRAVLITNPAYEPEIARSLAAMGVNAEVLVA